MNMKNNMYTNYLFDLYGTLVDIRTDEEKLELWEKLSLFYGYYGAVYTAEELNEAYLQEVKGAQEQARSKQVSSLKDGKLIGNKPSDSHEAYSEVQLEYVFQKLFRRKGVEADLVQSTYAGQVFRCVSTEYIRLYEGAKALLQGLRNKGRKVYLLSNAQNIFTRYELRYLGIETLFDDIFISSEYGCKKPDAAFYQKPIEKYGLDVEKTIMIGNDYTCDILGAQQVGLNTFYVHSNLSPDVAQEIESTYHLRDIDLNKAREILEG